MVTPNNWAFLYIEENDKVYLKLLFIFEGKQKMSAPIETVVEDEESYVLYTNTGFKYQCFKSELDTDWDHDYGIVSGELVQRENGGFAIPR